jgi:hypothetical protein
MDARIDETPERVRSLAEKAQAEPDRRKSRPGCPGPSKARAPTPARHAAAR